VALRFNPTVRAAGADTVAAKYGFDATAGAFMPNVSLEARALRGADSITYLGWRTEQSVKVIMSWDIFSGGTDSWKRAEAAERMIESSQREARLQRDIFESLDKAWAARTITDSRIAALTREIAAGRRVVDAYKKEWELGQRTLIDLLNAQNNLFNANVSLVSARGVAVFADYQLLAAMGQLLAYLKTAMPVDAEPIESGPFNLIPLKMPPILLHAPGPGPEPLRVQAAVVAFASAAPVVVADAAPDESPEGKFTERWPARKGANDPLVLTPDIVAAVRGVRGPPPDATAQNGLPQWAALSFSPQSRQKPLPPLPRTIVPGPGGNGN
jgi:hypothetical protein